MEGNFIISSPLILTKIQLSQQLRKLTFPSQYEWSWGSDSGLSDSKIHTLFREPSTISWGGGEGWEFLE